jgi:hypothetical protein
MVEPERAFRYECGTERREFDEWRPYGVVKEVAVESKVGMASRLQRCATHLNTKTD